MQATLFIELSFFFSLLMYDVLLMASLIYLFFASEYKIKSLEIEINIGCDSLIFSVLSKFPEYI